MQDSNGLPKRKMSDNSPKIRTKRERSYVIASTTNAISCKNFLLFQIMA